VEADKACWPTFLSPQRFVLRCPCCSLPITRGSSDATVLAPRRHLAADKEPMITVSRSDRFDARHASTTVFNQGFTVLETGVERPFNKTTPKFPPTVEYNFLLVTTICDISDPIVSSIREH
jgi:hypothetical protein